MKDPFEITAEVLEKVAAFVDAVEAEKLAAIAQEQNARAETVRETLKLADAAAVNDVIINKIAADPQITDLINALAKEASVAEEFGEATTGPTRKTAANLSAEEEAELGDKRFGEYLLST